MSEKAYEFWETCRNAIGEEQTDRLQEAAMDCVVADITMGVEGKALKAKLSPSWLQAGQNEQEPWVNED